MIIHATLDFISTKNLIIDSNYSFEFQYTGYEFICLSRSANQSELRKKGLEVKTISVNEAELSAKIKSVKKQ